MKTLLAVPITQLDPPPAEQANTAARAGADLIELRVDCLARAAGRAGIAAAEALLRQPRPAPYIITVRAAEEGGDWDADEAGRIALLVQLALRAPGYVDVEYSAWARSASVRQKVGLVCAPAGTRAAPDPHSRAWRAATAAGRRSTRVPNRLILSHHDAGGTPTDWEGVFKRISATPAAVVKIVGAARDATDAWRALALLERHAARRALIALATGAAGLASRVLAGKFGGFLTFAALTPQAASAPGQPTLQQLRQRYRWDRVGSATGVYGVIGHPLAHTLGPHIHNAAMAADGVDGVYLPLPVGATYDDFCAFMAVAAEDDWSDLRGLSVTLPHKEHALRWLKERGCPLSELARRCGAVNTLTRTTAGEWTGDNTDAAAVLTALESVPELAGGGLRGRPVDVLGAGGVARAVIAALLAAGCRPTLYNRTPERARRLAREMGCRHAPWEQRVRRGGSVLINCTPLGMWPDIAETPMPRAGLTAAGVVMDTVYNPPETRLLREAGARGCRTVSGMELFIGQAALQYERWHERPAPLTVMRAALPA